MADITVSSAVDTFMQAADAAEAREALGMPAKLTFDTGYTFVVAPDHADHAKFWLRNGDQPNVGDTAYGSWNPTAQFGYNVQGDLYDPLWPGISELFEASWCQDQGGGRGEECVVERHTVFIPCVDSTPYGAGTEIRLASYTIRAGNRMNGDPIIVSSEQVTAQIHYYMHVGAFELRNIHKTDPVESLYFSAFPGQVVLCGGSETAPTSFMVLEVSGGVFSFNPVGAGITAITMSVLQLTSCVSGTIDITSDALTSIESEGGMLLKKQMATYASACIYWYGLLGASEPTGIGGAMQLYGKVVGGVFVPHERMGGDAARILYRDYRTTSSANPTTTELPADGMQCIHLNTSNSKVFFAINYGGTIKGVELTNL